MKLQGALHWCTNIKVAKVVGFKDNQEWFCAMTTWYTHWIFLWECSLCVIVSQGEFVWPVKLSFIGHSWGLLLWRFLEFRKKLEPVLDIKYFYVDHILLGSRILQKFEHFKPWGLFKRGVKTNASLIQHLMYVHWFLYCVWIKGCSI